MFDFQGGNARMLPETVKDFLFNMPDSETKRALHALLVADGGRLSNAKWKEDRTSVFVEIHHDDESDRELMLELRSY
jgi:hypothetical protein